MSTRRDFLMALGLGAAGVFAPRFGRWHRQGSGLLVPEHDVVITMHGADGVLYWSDNPDVASVNTGGVVTAHRPGTAVIHASAHGVSRSLEVGVGDECTNPTDPLWILGAADLLRPV